MSTDIRTKVVIGYKLPVDKVEYAIDIEDLNYHNDEFKLDVVWDAYGSEWGYVGHELASVDQTDEGDEEIDFRKFDPVFLAHQIRKFFPDLDNVSQYDIKLYAFNYWY